MERIISHWSRWALGRGIVVDVLEFLVDPFESHGEHSDVVLSSWYISSCVRTQSWLWNEASQSDDSKYKCLALDTVSRHPEYQSQTSSMLLGVSWPHSRPSSPSWVTNTGGWRTHLSLGKDSGGAWSCQVSGCGLSACHTRPGPSLCRLPIGQLALTSPHDWLRPSLQSLPFSGRTVLDGWTGRVRAKTAAADMKDPFPALC